MPHHVPLAQREPAATILAPEPDGDREEDGTMKGQTGSHLTRPGLASLWLGTTGVLAGAVSGLACALLGAPTAGLACLGLTIVACLAVLRGAWLLTRVWIPVDLRRAEQIVRHAGDA